MLPHINLQSLDLNPIDPSRAAAGTVSAGSSELTGRFAEYLDKRLGAPQVGLPTGGEMLPETGNSLPPDDAGREDISIDVSTVSGSGIGSNALAVEFVFDTGVGVPVDVELPAGGPTSISDRQNASMLEARSAPGGQSPGIDISLTVRPDSQTQASPARSDISAVPTPARSARSNADRSSVANVVLRHDDMRTPLLADDAPPYPGGARPEPDRGIVIPTLWNRDGRTAAMTTPATEPAMTREGATADRTAAAATYGRSIAAEPIGTGMVPARDVPGIEDDAAIPRSLQSTSHPLAAAQAAMTADVTPPTDTVWRPGTETVSPAARVASPQPAPLPIDHPVQQPGWDRAVAERVILMANGNQQNAEIRLTPAELGPLKVRVTVDDGTASVVFQAQHALTRDAIEAAMPRLREMLADSGLLLGQATVRDDGAGQGGREGDAAMTRTADDGDGNGDIDRQSTADVALQTSRRADGLVDTFV